MALNGPRDKRLSPKLNLAGDLKACLVQLGGILDSNLQSVLSRSSFSPIQLLGKSATDPSASYRHLFIEYLWGHQMRNLGKFEAF